MNQIKECVTDAMAAISPTAPAAADIGNGMSHAIQKLQRGHEELSVEKRVSSLKTEGAQSQYRTIARMGLKLQAAAEKLDELSLSLEDTDDPLYRALSEIREDVSGAQEIGQERLDLIVRADSEPEFGWKAITKFEQAIQNGKSSNPEREKLFSECVRKVKEEKKKKPSKVTASQFGASLIQRPFHGGPGVTPGVNGFYAQQGYVIGIHAHYSFLGRPTLFYLPYQLLLMLCYYLGISHDHHTVTMWEFLVETR